MVKGLTDNFLLKISIAKLLLIPTFLAKYSVIPKLLPFKKFFLEIGPFINLENLFLFKISNAILKDSFK